MSAKPGAGQNGEIVDWFDGYDPHAIDEFVLNIAVSRIAWRRNAAKPTFVRKANVKV